MTTVAGPPARNPLEYLSFSRLNTYNGCGEKFRLRYLERTPEEPGGALLGGSAVHTALEVMERGQLWATDEGVLKAQKVFQDDFDAQLSEASDSPYPIRWAGRKSREYPNGEDERWWRFMGPLFVKRACHLRRADTELGFSVRPDGVEIKVLTKLTDQISVKGYIDAFLMTTDDGEVLIRDWKTGKVGGNDGLQLATYAWALREAGVSAPTVGQYAYLRAADAKKGVQTYDLTPYLDIVPDLYRGLVAGIEAGVYAMKPSFFCSSCGVRRACAYGKALDEGGKP